MTTYVLIPGVFVGSWVWQPVARILTQAGQDVYATSLTGIGERVHLASPEVDLDTHILDVANILQYNQLDKVILVGYSYGGMVAAGVAERMPERIKRLVYLDALDPQDGQSALGMLDPQVAAATMQMVATAGNGWLFPLSPGMDARFTPQPIKTLTQPVSVQNPLAAQISRAFILCTEDKKEPYDPFHIPIIQAAVRARRDPRYVVFEIAGRHDAIYVLADQVAEILLKLGE